MRQFFMTMGCTALLALSLPGPARAFTAVNGLHVNPVPGGFEVVTPGRDGPRQIWCAAGHYATRAGVGGNQRIFIRDGYGPSMTAPGKRAVRFGVKSGATGGTRPGSDGNYSVSIRKPGFSLSTAHASQFCHDVFEIDEAWPL